MPKFVVLVNAGSITIGGLGRSRVQESVRIVADSAADARKLARKQTGKTVHSVEQVFRFAVTLRGHADKRKRETFYMEATSERYALRALSYNPRTWDFARLGSTPARWEKAVVKITKEPA